jgi:serine/threonine protein kinase
MAASEITLPARFRIDEEIGRGGMAVVYRAHDRHLDRFVAIKVLSSGLSHTLGAERFQREIALMAKLVHPGIVALFDSGEVDGRLYYVMPLVAGENLRARLKRERRMSVEDTVAFGADIAEALAYAHGAGIVHRDVKPENIFTVGGRALLADFGIAHIAKEQGGDQLTLTSPGIVLGTVAYMSPEQATGESRIDGRSDLYSLGCVLYEMTTAVPPFTGETAVGVLAKHIVEAPRPARDRNAGISIELNSLIMQLLSKDPTQRPATAGDVARALRSGRPTIETVPARREPSDAEHLVDEALKSIYLSVSAGPSGRTHLEQAAAYLKRALSLDPHNARVLCALANWQYTMGRAGFLPAEQALLRGASSFSTLSRPTTAAAKCTTRWGRSRSTTTTIVTPPRVTSIGRLRSIRKMPRDCVSRASSTRSSAASIRRCGSRKLRPSASPGWRPSGTGWVTCFSRRGATRKPCTRSSTR